MDPHGGGRPVDVDAVAAGGQDDVRLGEQGIERGVLGGHAAHLGAGRPRGVAVGLAAEVAAVERFRAGDRGAEVGEDPGRERARLAGQVDDADPLQHRIMVTPPGPAGET